MQKQPHKSNFWGYFQSLGKTFMLPVSLLAAMGLLLGIGSAFTSSDMLARFPLLSSLPMRYLFGYMSQIGGLAFSNLSIMFAIAIPLGLSRQEKGVAAFAGFVGFMAMHLGTNFALQFHQMIPSDPTLYRSLGQSTIMGIHTIDTGVLGGIMVGAIVARLHTRFYTIKLPDAFAFFGGPRFVPIISALVASVMGLIVPFIWPFFSNAIVALGGLIQKSGIFAPMVFFTSERLLIPIGLHHILVAMVRFTEIGGSELVGDQMVHGALNIFYAQIRDGYEISASATQFLSQGKMPSFLFGLPAVTLAMYHTAFKENRPVIKSLFLSGVIASVVGGITEPIEFLFLFISPMLFLFHAIMTGLGAMVVALLGIRIGNTDGNLIDLVIYGVLQGNDTRWWLILVIGPIWGVLYYVVFRMVIRKKNLKTPGREIIESPEATQDDPLGDGANSRAQLYLNALGGRENILSLDNCITRLRLEIHDAKLVDDAQLKRLGATGVIHVGDQALQVIIGPQVHLLRQEIDKLL
ncbi:maltose/glucose-specific PTS transporter subunit IIBC [Entomospira culicis]|uniref:PTS maltose transporter subunit IICB n=1 Tax=Entomospira culicis TaxID=2719989 RepID=A0A968KTX0_9SPIO|nr:maltose/glucose-specific PTS transporter subunit IIBC [Entomospira culicis]NIZ18684.1 PTS maltose transporter subunit IICB [Entomospira culicis]NIZ68899.1 PTS maltose transporter subunit IICB [Entomospira culicis]WDI37492.1 maltose/glucose-specific PTS transporter subunit IIBC [Entomospira culicis]WDI39120.1 maltose/glucose-specific PTS transporter subunit IIBC [Entomospira culicis]